MRKVYKRILSLFLCICMILSSSITTFAVKPNWNRDGKTLGICVASSSDYMDDMDDLIALVQEVKATSPMELIQNSKEMDLIESRIEKNLSVEEELLSIISPVTERKQQEFQSTPDSAEHANQDDFQSTPDSANRKDDISNKSTPDSADKVNKFSGGSGLIMDPYIISSIDDLRYIEEENKRQLFFYYRLDADIDMRGKAWTPIGDTSTPFIGYIDGNGHAIKDLVIDTSNTYIGLIGFAKDSTVQNLEFTGAAIKGGLRVGTLIGQGANCTFDNISLKGCSINGNGFTGGMAGVLSNSTVVNCDNDGHIMNSGSYTGGVVSFMIDGTIENTVFTGNIDGKNYTGGIAGTTSGNIYTCTNAGDIHGTVTTGGIAGELSYTDRLRDIQHCYNSGNIEGENEVGGISGYSLSALDSSYGARIVAVANVGKVHSNGSYAGGIIGDMASNTFIVSSYNRGDISADERMCGGIAGRYNTLVNYTSGVSAVYNAGKVKEGAFAGSLIGYSCATVVTKTFYISEMEEGYQVPGIARYNTSGVYSVIKKTSAELKTMAETLGSSRFTDDTELINGGYPILLGLNYINRNAGRNGRDFKFGSTFNNIYDTTAQYYYSDEYFMESSYNYNEHLATMSLSLALSAFASHETGYEDQYINAQNLMEDVGFTNIGVNDYYKEKPTTDSIGVIVGMKNITFEDADATLIAVAIRGAGYESEWASNFKIGSSGFHQGFWEARHNVLEYLANYLKDNSVKGRIKIWITGYSRAAATANLVAGALDGGMLSSVYNFSPEDIYAYTFETPRGAVSEFIEDDEDSTKYANIFNIINLNDPVPKVAPVEWDFHCYGINKLIPTKENMGEDYDLYLESMLKCYNDLGFGSDDKSKYVIDDFAVKLVDADLAYYTEEHKFPIQIIDNKGMSQAVFLDNTVEKLANEGFKNRQNYVIKYQQGIREIIATLYKEGNEESKDLFYETFKRKFFDDIEAFILCTGVYIKVESVYGMGELLEIFEKDPLSRIKNYIVESAIESGIVSMSDEEVDRFASNVLQLINDFVIPNWPTFLTMALNPGIPQAHYPEICLAWTRSMDSYYTPGGAPSFVPGGYRIVRINGTVNVNVYSSDGELVSTIESDNPDEQNNVVSSAINEDFEKLVYLPSGNTYSVILKATDDSELSCSINEYNPMVGGITRIVSFKDVSLISGESITIDIPILEETGNNTSSLLNLDKQADYELIDNNGNNIIIEKDLLGKEAREACYMIVTEVNNASYGLVTGSGVRQYGNYARVSAKPYEGMVFSGWYSGLKLVSVEEDYCFKVKKDTTLTAVFKSSNDNG